jgi:hypothetical protein
MSYFVFSWSYFYASVKNLTVFLHQSRVRSIFSQILDDLGMIYEVTNVLNIA